MKILQTIQGLSAKSGGPSTCTKDLLEGLYSLESCVDLLAFKPRNLEDQMLANGSAWLISVVNDSKSPLGFSKNFYSSIISSNYDIYHCNGLWMFSNHITCKVARDKGKPYILSPHGMLYPTALRISAWKKKIMLNVWFNKDIHSATCLHATCKQEMEHCRTFGYKGPIAVIPNPVVFPEGVEIKKKVDSQKKIGFLGRLHPIKKVENLIYGAAKAIEQGCESFTIEIMGKGSDEYEDFLRKEIDRLKLQSIVNFVGFVSGKDKYDRLSSLRALMVPSEQENFGMIVPEALICGTPVYASLGTPWEELNSFHCGWWKDNSPETVANVIQDIIAKSDEEILQMGSNGRKLMEEKYEQKKVASMMFDLYKWILGEINKPEFVYV
jgi:glycosyltransferase involved in cell wall biosynthesis